MSITNIQCRKKRALSVTKQRVSASDFSTGGESQAFAELSIIDVCLSGEPMFLK